MSKHLLAEANWRDVVRQRLHSVSVSLTVLQEKSFGSEGLHDARVACRQAEAMLRICRDLLPARHVTWLRTQLRQLRHAVNSARDREVLVAWLEGQEGPSACKLRACLRNAQRVDHAAVTKFAKSLMRSQQFNQHMKRAGQPRVGSAGVRSWRSKMACRLMDEFTHFLRALPQDGCQSQQLHRLRIASKRLRYACEFVAEVITESHDIPLHQLLRQIQDRLGQLNDAVVRQTQFQRFERRGVVILNLPCPTEEQERLLVAWQHWWASNALDEILGRAVTKILQVALKAGASCPHQKHASD